MKRFYLTLFLLALSLPIFAISFFDGSYQEALQKAKSEKKDVLLYFTARWCGPCQYMQKYVFNNDSVSSYANNHYVSLKINIDTYTGKKLHFRYGQMGVPDFYIITWNENVLKVHLGAMKASQLLDFLAKSETPEILYKAAPDSLANIKTIAANKFVDSMLLHEPELRKNAKYLYRNDTLAKTTAMSPTSKPNMFEEFYFNSMVSKWKPGIKMGLSTSSLDQNVSESKLVTGVYAGLFVSVTNQKFQFQPGIQYNMKGGSILGIVNKLHYLEMPLLLSYAIGHHHIYGKQDIRVNLIPYGAVNLWSSQKISNNAFIPSEKAPSFKRLDYGAKLGLSFVIGSFEPFLGYDLGLANISNNSMYVVHNRSYYISFALIIGK